MLINRRVCAPLLGLFCAGLAAAQTGLIQTYAGNGIQGYAGDGGAATSAEFSAPTGLVFDANGNLYVADATNRRVRKVSASTGIITTVAGGGTGGAGGLATAAMLQGPCGLAFDSAGDLYVSDSCTSASGGGGGGGGNSYGNGVIWRVDAVTGIITIVAGGGATLGDGGPATSGAINLPVGIAVDAANDIFIADSGNNRIRRVDGVTGVITTVAGNGTAAFAGDGALATAASLNSPSSVALDAAGNLYIADSLNNRIRRVDAASGIITTLAGTGAAGFNGDGLAATGASLNYPIFVAVNPSGNLLVTDSQNYRLRMLDMTSGLIWTVAGTGFPTNGCCGNGDGGPAAKAPLDAPMGLAVLPSGPLFISELRGYRVREVSLPSPYADSAITVSANAHSVPAGQPVTLTATVAAINGLAANATGAVAFFDGNSNLTQVPVTSGSATYTTSTLSQGQHSISAIYSGDSSFAYGLSPTFSLSVTAPQANVALAASPNPANPNQAITLTATVTPSNATGSVQFLNGSTSLGIVSLTNATATLAGVTLPAGTYSLTAQYSGGNGLPAATSPVVSLTVKAASSVALASSANPSTAQQSVTFTASISPATAAGSVQFLDGTTALGTATLSNGAASFSTSTLTQGTHSITASYAGDANDTSATSAVFTQTVQAVSAISISTNQNPVVVGGIVIISAAVTPSTATGTVQFLDGATVLGSAALANGAASFTTTSLAQGTHQLTAAYSGDSSDAASTSAVLSESIKLSVGFGLTISPSPAVVGQTVTMTVNMSTQAATGTVSFSDGSTLLGTVPLSAGTAVFATSSLGQGTHSINVVYSGDSNYLGASAAPYTETILGASSVALTANPNPALSGQAVTFTATVSPSAAMGTIQFLDGGTAIGSATVQNGSASFSTSSLAAGTHSITASYGGSSTYNASTSTAVSEVIKANTTTSLSTSANPATVGAAVTFTAVVSPSAATGTVQFLDGSTVLGSAALSNGTASFSTSGLTTGTHSITASYGGSGSYNSSTSSVLSEVLKTNTSIAISSSLNPSTAGAAVTFLATVSPSNATGTVQFLDGATLLGTSTLAGGSASLTTSALAQGAHSITAAYSGDTLDNASASGVLGETVNPAVPAPPSNLTAGASGSGQINLAWTASPSSGVTYNVYASTTSGFVPSASNRIGTGVAGTAYSVTGLVAGTTYYFRVTAMNAGGESAASNQAGATAAGFACHVGYSVSSQSKKAFDGAISIENTGTTNITSWTLTWTWPGSQRVSSAWNAKEQQSGANVTLTNESYNGKINAGATLSGIGFGASYSGTNTAPSAFYVNGTLCR